MTTDKKDLTKAQKRYFGFDTFKGDQEAIIRNVLDVDANRWRQVIVLSVAVAVDGRCGYRHLTSHRFDEEPGGLHRQPE